MQHSRILTTILVAGLAGSAHNAAADINGFGNFSQFSINKADTASDPSLGPNSIRLTSAGGIESRSIFYNTPQSIGQFSASFTYRASNLPANSFGVCFVLQNSVSGAKTVASTGWQLGYGDQWGTFSRSIAVSLESVGQPSGPTYTGLYSNGTVGGGALPTAPVTFSSGNPIAVTIAYDGFLLHSTFIDKVTGASFESFFAPNIPLTVGGPNAFVGFVAGNGGTNFGSDGAEQFISDFTFTSVPAPGSAIVLGLGTLAARRRR